MAKAAKKNGHPAGGRAEAAGGNYETLVASWYCVRILAGCAGEPPVDLPADVRLLSIRCQTEAPVDDVLIETSAKGFVFIQAKRSIDLSPSETSQLASVADEFIRQYKESADAQSGHSWSRPLDPDRDRLVLVTPSSSSSKITQILPKLLRAVRQQEHVETLSEVQNSAKDREVASVIEAQISRIWTAVNGAPPTRADMGRLLRLIRVQVLDVEAEGGERNSALDLLRGTVLEQPDAARTAWSSLVEFCGQLRGESSGAHGPSLQNILIAGGVALLAAPDYRADIRALRDWTAARLNRTASFTRLIETRPETAIRRSISAPLGAAAEAQSFLVVGEPGAGKSGVCYQLAHDLSNVGRDVVLVPVDVLNVDTMGGLSGELRIAHPLSEVIRNWPGAEPGILIIDALDAARKPEKQALLRGIVEELRETAGDRWRIIASVRRYDLRQGTEWARLFRGAPPIPNCAEPEFQHLRHIFIKKLEAQELTQIATSYPALNELLQTASAKLWDLLLNIFNLHLLAELLNDGVLSTQLKDIRTQPELLDAYWRHRVHGNDGRRDPREGILLSAAAGMIASRALQVARATLRNDPNIGALNDLERQGVLVASEADGRPDDDILLFAHNILFDYAVARLVLRRGREPAYLVNRLRETPELALMLGPSLTLAMADRWGANRNDFWSLSFALEREPAIPEIARLQAPMVIAEDGSVGIADLEPLLTALGTGTGTEAAEAFLQHLIGALFVLAMTGRALVGPGAGPWSVLAERLAAFKRDRLAYGASPLVSKLMEQIDAATAEQLQSLGEASRELLTYAWARRPRQSRLITAALHATCVTIASNVEATGQLLREALQPAHMEQFAYEELRHITRNIDRIIDADAGLAAAIYEAAFTFDERSDATTDMSGSQLLGLRSNRRQDYQGSWYELTKLYPKFLKTAPEEAAWSLNKSMEGYVVRQHAYASTTIAERTVEFYLGTRAATYIVDFSSIWLQTAIGSRQDAPQLIVKLAAECSSDDGEVEGRLRHVISTLMDNARFAVMWRTALDLASRKPAIVGHDVVPLVCTAPVLTNSDTREAAGRFISAAYPHLSEDDRAAIETAIIGLEGRQGDRAKRVLLGCIPADLFATPEAHAIYDQLSAAGEIRENRPAFEMRGGFVEHDPDFYLRAEGVPIEEPANRELRELTAPVDQFWTSQRSDQLTEASVIAILPAMDALHSVVTATPIAAHEAVIERGFGMLAEAANVIANLAPDALKRIGAWDLVVRILLSSSRAAWPVLSAEFEEQFNSSASWGAPCARVAAAQGLMKLLRAADENDRGPLRDAVLELARDPVARVRFQIACALNTLWCVDQNLVWDEITRFVLEDENRGVIGGALGSLGAVAGTDLDRTAGLAVELLHCFPPGDKRSGVGQCRENCIWLLSDLDIHADHARSRAEIDRLVQTPNKNSQLLRHLLARRSDTLTVGAPGRPDDPQHAIRARTLRFYADVLDAATSRLDDVFAGNNIDRFDEWDEPDKLLVRNMYGILDELSIRLLFATGGHPSGSPITLAEVRLFDEAREFFKRLADCLVPTVAHHVIETMERYIDVAPSEVFALIARSVRAGERGGYAIESMAATLVVRIVERYLADHSEVFEAADRRRDLMNCLDVFVRAGWPAAQALTFRIPEIWR